MRFPAVMLFVLGIVSITGAISVNATAQTAEPAFSIKSDSPPTDSAVRPDVEPGDPVPMNRTYEQLTPRQRATVHSLFGITTPGDEPPYPAEGMTAIDDAIRKAQEKLLVRGELRLIATVEASGEVSSVKVIRSSSSEMAKFAGSILLLTKFKPAICSGQPCKMDFPLVVKLSVKTSGVVFIR